MEQKYAFQKLQQENEALRKQVKKWKSIAFETREGNNNLLKEIRRLEKELANEKIFIQNMF